MSAPIYSKEQMLELYRQLGRINDEGELETRILVPQTMTSFVGPNVTGMQYCDLLNAGFYAQRENMIEGRATSLNMMLRGLKLGEGSALVGCLDPDGAMATILEEYSMIMAMCELLGVLGKGSILSTGTILTPSVAVYAMRTKKLLEKEITLVANGNPGFLL